MVLNCLIDVKSSSFGTKITTYVSHLQAILLSDRLLSKAPTIIFASHSTCTRRIQMDRREAHSFASSLAFVFVVLRSPNTPHFLRLYQVSSASWALSFSIAPL